MILRGSDSPCKGRLEVRRDSKSPWGLVCYYGWTKENGAVVCESLKCGNVTRSGLDRTLYTNPPLPKQYLMDQVNCESTYKPKTNLWECKFAPPSDQKCRDGFVYVECSGM